MHTSIHSGGTGKHPAFPTQWFYGLYVISPATNSSCHRRPTDCMASHIPVGLSVPPRDLTPTTGARTTRLHRPQQCRSSRAPLLIAHECDPPCDLMRTRHHRVHRIPPHVSSRFV